MSDSTKIDQVVEVLSNLDKQVALSQAALVTHARQLEEMYDELKRMNNILQLNTDSLREHMSQTALLKATVLKIDARLLPIEVERVKKATIAEFRWGMITLTTKVIGFMLGSGGLVWGIVETLTMLHK